MQKITFEDYPSTNTPVNSTNLNQVQTNVENAITQAETTLSNSIGAVKEFSTTETEVGKWVDNKSIYRKTIYLSSLPNETTQSYDFSDYSIVPTMLIDARGVAYNSTNGTIFIINGARESFAGVISLRATITSSTKRFTIQTGQDRRSLEAYITFWYLKD